MRKRDAYLDDEIVPDGGSVRRPMLLMDGRRFAVAFDAENHVPHYARPTGARRTRHSWKSVSGSFG